MKPLTLRLTTLADDHERWSLLYRQILAASPWSRPELLERFLLHTGRRMAYAAVEEMEDFLAWLKAGATGAGVDREYFLEAQRPDLDALEAWSYEALTLAALTELGEPATIGGAS